MADPLVAFLAAPDEHAREVRVNFGMFAGRDATQAEMDELARRLLPLLGAVSIVSEQRHEVTEHGEAALHQVRIDLERGAPADDVLEIAERWAQACIAERHVV